MEYIVKQGELVLSGVAEILRDKATGQFAKGNKVVWNKGMKGIRLSPDTEFKKGNEPHNTKYDGCISIRTHKRDNKKYKYIRISKGNWQLLNRYVWEQNNGPIPKGMIIRHIDGDTMNCQISNLKIISKAENLSLNYDREKMTEGIKEAWRRDRIRHKYGMPLRTKLLNRQIKNQKI
jgi:hypothetical protein